MKKTILTAMVVALGLGFAGCKEEEAYYTAEYYKKNPEERAKQVKVCESADKLTAVQFQNCQIAHEVDIKNKQTRPPFKY